MKKLFFITIFLLTFNVFASEKNYSVCKSEKIEILINCVNQFIHDGYKPLSGLHAVNKNSGRPIFFQSLIKK